MGKDRFLERQPNSDTREEFLIVIDYLKNEAFDEEHASTQAEIIEYAKNKYNKDIRRDRIGQILIHLEQLSNSDAFQLPFKLKTVKLNKIQKYYVPQRNFSDEEIVRILSALEKDPNLSLTLTKELCGKILNIFANNNKHEQLLLKSHKRISGIKKENEALIEISESFLKMVDNHDRIIFHLRDYKDADFSSHRFDPNLKEKLEKEENFGFAYCVITPDREPLPVIYLDEQRIAMVTKFSNLVIDEVHQIWEDIDETSYFVLEGRYKNKSINDWLNDHYKGKDGLLQEYKLMYHIYNEKDFIEYQNKFKEYWKEDFKFRLDEKILSHPSIDKNGNVVKKGFVSRSAIFEIKANKASFDNWYEKMGHFNDTIILEPAYLNEMFLEEKIRRYTARLNKYSGRYNYHLGKEIKSGFTKELGIDRDSFSYRRNNLKHN